jgi:hypothetical protein
MYLPASTLGLSLMVNSSLDLTKVPDKLHCPGCHNFLANAYKTPCCDQAICEACESLAGPYRLQVLTLIDQVNPPSVVNVLFVTIRP